jgi:hypothetical protein
MPLSIFMVSGFRMATFIPGNVMLDRESGNVYLIDIPDFSHNTAESKKSSV